MGRKRKAGNAGEESGMKSRLGGEGASGSIAVGGHGVGRTSVDSFGEQSITKRRERWGRATTIRGRRSLGGADNRVSGKPHVAPANNP